MDLQKMKGLLSLISKSGKNKKQEPFIEPNTDGKKVYDVDVFPLVSNNAKKSTPSGSPVLLHSAEGPPFSISRQIGTGNMIQAQGDLQPSSSSHVGSASWTADDPSTSHSFTKPSYLSEAPRSRCNSDFSFPTASVNFDNESCRMADFDDEDIHISERGLASVMNDSEAYSISTYPGSSMETDGDYDSSGDFSTGSTPFSSTDVSYGESYNSEIGNVPRGAGSKDGIHLQKKHKPSPQFNRVVVKKVFMTYAKEPGNPNHLKTIASIALLLDQHNEHFNYTAPDERTTFKLDMKSDLFEKLLIAGSRCRWLEERINEADYVLVCISPGYRKLVESEGGNDELDEESYENSLHAKYIHTRIHSEYIVNGSKNYFIVPLLVSGATRKDIPRWMNDFIVYSWDGNRTPLIFRLIGREEHIMPRPGPLPRLEIQQRFQTVNPRVR